MSDLDLSFVDETVERLGRGEEAVIGILLAIQERYRYLPAEALRRVCEISDVHPSTITGVATFYDRFRHAPAGEHTIRVCVGTACHVKGAGVVHDAFCRHLDIPEGQDTDAERLFTVEKVACLGCCTLAPVVQIRDVTYGHLTAAAVGGVLSDYLAQLEERAGRKEAEAQIDGRTAEIRISLDSCCIARGTGLVYEALQRAVDETGAGAVIKRVGCVGMCYQTPLVEIVKPGRPSAFYACVHPSDARAIVRKHFPPKALPKRMARAVSNALDTVLTDETWQPVTRYAIDMRDPGVAEFLDPQEHLATELWGVLDPLDMDEYLSGGGFDALKHCIGELAPDEIISRIEASGLRGRGGAGFTTGQKWRLVRNAPGDKKYIVCNGDEGDPGAFMDRMLLESYPLRIIEGLLIAAYAVGADEAVMYIRDEYPVALLCVTAALVACEERGFIGRRILGSDFSMTLRIMRGAGAFVCGEETALLASIEGRRGMPRLRPPFPAERGLWGKPTLVNNVETYAIVPWTIRHGSAALAAMGSEGSKGTKVFSLAGKIARGGLIEVPMGISIHDVIEEIGGGCPDGRFKAVQIGGPSGGCVPASLRQTAIDYEALTGAGAMMGSGGLVVLDEHDCMVDIARYFLEFTQDQSCGKCTFCRIGTRRMLDILERLCNGEGKKGDLEELEHLAKLTKAGSLCGLGKTAPNPVLSTLKYFRREYEAHLAGRCPAGVCKALVVYSITDDCIGCTKCAQACPTDSIAMRPYEVHEIDTETCVRCGECKDICPVDAVVVE